MLKIEKALLSATAGLALTAAPHTGVKAEIAPTLETKAFAAAPFAAEPLGEPTDTSIAVESAVITGPAKGEPVHLSQEVKDGDFDRNITIAVVGPLAVAMAGYMINETSWHGGRIDTWNRNRQFRKSERKRLKH